MAFAHLHIHTHYSVSDSIVKVPELFEGAAELGLSGLAITDPTSMSGVPEFLACAKRYPNIKPVVGCSFSLTNHIPHTKVDADNMQLFCVILLAKNLTGYHNLIKLSTTAYTEAGDYIVRQRRNPHKSIQILSEQIKLTAALKYINISGTVDGMLLLQYGSCRQRRNIRVGV